MQQERTSYTSDSLTLMARALVRSAVASLPRRLNGRQRTYEGWTLTPHAKGATLRASYRIIEEHGRWGSTRTVEAELAKAS